MADTKISLLTGATAAAGTNELPINEAGSTKKLTVRQLQEFVTDKGSNVASAGTITLGDGHFFHITGTTTITDLDFTDSWDGRLAFLVFDGALTLTHNGTSLILPGGVNISTQAGDIALIVVESGDNVRVLFYQKAAMLFNGPMLITGNSGAANAGNPPCETWQVLSANAAANATTTPAAVMTTTSLPAGTYYFEYNVVYQSSNTGNGVNFQVDYTGTVTRVRATRIGQTALTTAVDGITNQVINALTGGTVQAWAGRSDAANLGPSTGVGTASADQYEQIRGILVVSTSANLQLMFASEAAVSVQVMADTCLFLKRLA